MNKYLITLKPVEEYFFGGENTFRSNENDEANYFARSNPYPQQTSLLGVLRYLLLVSNNALPIKNNKDKAEKLIGEKSFDASPQKTKQEFGVIDNISPLYIIDKKTNALYRITMPYEDFEVNFKGNGNILLSTRKDFVPEINGYNPKKLYLPILKDKDGNTLSFNDVFKELPARIGISKDREQGDDKKFYKQIFYTLNDDYAFAFYADIAGKYENIDTTIIEKGVVFFGGEKKQFEYRFIKPEDEKYISEPDFSSGNDKIALLSDALIGKELLEKIKFMINNVQEFRTVKIAFDNHKFDKEQDVSGKINLLKRGTVIFADDPSEIETELNNPIHYRKIGFNHFIKL